MKCADCFYYRRRRNDLVGICKRYPPIPVPNTYEKHLGDGVTVTTTDVEFHHSATPENSFCGEFKNAEKGDQ